MGDKAKKVLFIGIIAVIVVVIVAMVLPQFRNVLQTGKLTVPPPSE